MQNLKIGILGGSFNPPHEGHIHISNIAIKKLGLHQVWWLVAKQNPFKNQYSNSFIQRVHLSKRMLKFYNKIQVLEIEQNIKNPYSYNVIKSLQAKFKNVNFIWIMGSDNLMSFHKWYRWKELAQNIPIAIFERNGYVYNTLKTPFTSKFASICYRNPQLLSKSTTGWHFIRTKVKNISSSAINKLNK